MKALYGDEDESENAYIDITPAERTKQLNNLESRLDEMEEDLAEQEQALRVRHKSKNKQKKKCCHSLCKCLSTADIKRDIPGRFQRSVYCMFYLWICTACTLIMNLVTMLIFNEFDGSSKPFSSDLLMTSLFVLIGIPGTCIMCNYVFFFIAYHK